MHPPDASWLRLGGRCQDAVSAGAAAELIEIPNGAVAIAGVGLQVRREIGHCGVVADIHARSEGDRVWRLDPVREAAIQLSRIYDEGVTFDDRIP